MTDILRMSLPLTVWLAAFSAIYGLEGLVCSDRWAEAGFGPSAGRGALVMVWVLALASQLAFLLALRSPAVASPSRFIQQVSLTLAATALVATVWTLLPVTTTTLCSPTAELRQDAVWI